MENEKKFSRSKTEKKTAGSDVRGIKNTDSQYTSGDIRYCTEIKELKI